MGTGLSLECAGRAQRRRRFGFSVALRQMNDPKRYRRPDDSDSATALQIETQPNRLLLPAALTRVSCRLRFIACVPILTKAKSSLTSNQRRGFAAAWGGWLLDGMDSFIYALVMVDRKSVV